MILLAASLVLSGCTSKAYQVLDKTAQAKETGQTVKSVSVYFSGVCGHMIPVAYPLDESGDDAVRTAVELLLEGPRSEHLFRTIPKGTLLKDSYVSNETVYLDFTKEFNKLSNTKDAAKAVKSLCLTMGSIPGIDRVQVFVEGQPLSEIQGVSMGQIMEHRWVNYYGEDNQGTKFMVYYTDCDYLYMVPITYLSESSEGVPRAAVARLLEGPNTNTLRSTAIPGIRLLNIAIKEGVAYIDFSKEVTAFGEDVEAEKRFVESLLLTLGQFSDVKSVQIMVEGKIQEYLSGSVIIGVPLSTIPITSANPLRKVIE